MTQAVVVRSDAIRASLARHRLVLIQMGAAFEAMRQSMLERLGAELVTVSDVLSKTYDFSKSASYVITDIEVLVTPTSGRPEVTMGALREIVIKLMDEGKNICLVSRAPRVAFASIPGSSILEDAALLHLPLLSLEECPNEGRSEIGWKLPTIGMGADVRLEDLFVSILKELGPGVLSSLDHCVFEIDPRGAAGLAYLSHRDKEALRCAGLVEVDTSGRCSLTIPNRLLELKSALADVISSTTVPARDLAAVVNGLWYIERTIRSTLRSAAVSIDGPKWRSSIVGALSTEVLSRARLDSSISAASVKELRDPLEWLTLGELLDIARSNKFNGLGVDAVIWRRFVEQVMPIRNRVSHMRDLKGNDEEIVGMWVGLVRQQLG